MQYKWRIFHADGKNNVECYRFRRGPKGAVFLQKQVSIDGYSVCWKPMKFNLWQFIKKIEPLFEEDTSGIEEC